MGKKRESMSFTKTVTENIANDLAVQSELNNSLNKKLKLQTEKTDSLQKLVKQLSPENLMQDKKRGKNVTWATVKVKITRMKFTIRKTRCMN